MQQISDVSNAFCCKDCIVELNSDRENKREKEGKRLWCETLKNSMATVNDIRLLHVCRPTIKSIVNIVNSNGLKNLQQRIFSLTQSFMAFECWLSKLCIYCCAYSSHAYIHT